MDPIKVKARANVNNILLRRPCVICGTIPAEGHHEDYSKPLEVIWLCKYHHTTVHQLEKRGYKLDDILDLEIVKQEAVPLPKNEQLAGLARLTKRQVSLEDYIADVEQKLANAKAKLRETSEYQIPELMSQLGIKEFRLSNGFKINTKAWYSLKIPEDLADKAYNWLEENGHGSIVKAAVTVNTRMTHEKKLEAIKKLAEELGFDVTQKLGIHHQTGSAWIREQIEKGEEIPRELLGITQGFRTKIQRSM